uniref:Uncharacterized protein n=1 Tax=Rousettus aegyptiacus TaxID=9407 RepID=A0A7J8F225_ROUAE|nr:hypothetical protein HJG63_012432 [Rousettus aegyptiacus]
MRKRWPADGRPLCRGRQRSGRPGCSRADDEHPARETRSRVPSEELASSLLASSPEVGPWLTPGLPVPGTCSSTPSAGGLGCRRAGRGALSVNLYTPGPGPSGPGTQATLRSHRVGPVLSAEGFTRTQPLQGLDGRWDKGGLPCPPTGRRGPGSGGGAARSRSRDSLGRGRGRHCG